MFKYCVWYVLEPTHYIYKDIKLYSQMFKTNSFIPHITIRHSINTLDEAIQCMLKYKSMQRYYNPVFKPKINIDINTTEIQSINKLYFHSIELPLYKNKFIPEIKNPHISLVYKINGRPFNEKDTNYLLDYKTDFENLSIKVVDCHSENPSEWFFINPLDSITKYLCD